MNQGQASTVGSGAISNQWRISPCTQEIGQDVCDHGLVHTVVILALDGVIAFDLATPLEVFGHARGSDGEQLYEIAVAGPMRHVSAGAVGLAVPHGLEKFTRADTIVIPGRVAASPPLPESVVRAVRAAAQRGTRIASICVGALDLAATGLLDGLRATTHWRAADVLRTTYPDVEVTADVLFVDNGQVLTSAGASAGIDLCLHMIARDHGGGVAADAARIAVMPLTREANQAQFIRDDAIGDTALSTTLEWIERNTHLQISVADIASHATVSPRTLHRRFIHELGVTPSTWLAKARVRAAQRLLETTNNSVDRIATQSGLGSATNLRSRFKEIVGTTPTQYRRALGSPPTVNHAE